LVSDEGRANFVVGLIQTNKFDYLWHETHRKNDLLEMTFGVLGRTEWDIVSIACITGTFFRNRDFSTVFYGFRDPGAGTGTERNLNDLVTVLSHPEKTRSGSTLLGGIEFKFL
jgi:hypothetical protein